MVYTANDKSCSLFKFGKFGKLTQIHQTFIHQPASCVDLPNLSRIELSSFTVKLSKALLIGQLFLKITSFLH